MRKLPYLVMFLFITACSTDPANKDIIITYHYLSHNSPYTIAYTEDGKLKTSVAEELYTKVDAKARIGSTIQARLSIADTTFSSKIMISYGNHGFAEKSGKGYVDLTTTVPLDILER